jgi:hypothetical protein
VKKVTNVKGLSTDFREQAWKKQVVASEASNNAFLEAAAKREQFLTELSAALKAIGVDLRGLLDAHTKAILSSDAMRQ